MKRLLGLLLVCVVGFAVVPASGASAAGVIYDNGRDGTATLNSQNYEPDLDEYDDQAADDFLVPKRTAWTIERVEVDGDYYRSGQAAGTVSTQPVPTIGTARSVNVFFYRDARGLPGDAVYTAHNAPIATDTGGRMAVNLAQPVRLTAGRYWLSVQANYDVINGEWGWQTTNELAIKGSEAAWRNPGGGFGIPQCTNWGKIGQTCGLSNPTWGLDLAFRLVGTTGR